MRDFTHRADSANTFPPLSFALTSSLFSFIDFCQLHQSKPSLFLPSKPGGNLGVISPVKTDKKKEKKEQKNVHVQLNVNRIHRNEVKPHCVLLTSESCFCCLSFSSCQLVFLCVGGLQYGF